MRTMPMLLASSVDVASTARAQRMHRKISTEATGRWLESMLMRYPEEETVEVERCESEEEDLDEDIMSVKGN
jgi:hypothetical protein